MQVTLQMNCLVEKSFLWTGRTTPDENMLDYLSISLQNMVYINSCFSSKSNCYIIYKFMGENTPLALC